MKTLKTLILSAALLFAANAHAAKGMYPMQGWFATNVAGNSTSVSTVQTNIGLTNVVRTFSDNVLTGSNYFSGALLVSNAAGIFNVGTVLSTNLNGNIGNLSNGVVWSSVLFAPTMTNGVNHGNAFSSPGSGTSSEQFGASSSASANTAVAVGYSSAASAESSLAVGYSATASAPQAISIGYSTTASGTGSVAIAGVALDVNTVAIGVDSEANAKNSTALGNAAVAGYENSTALGYGATTTTSNQTVIGSGTVGVNISGALTVAGTSAFGGALYNATFSGTNKFPAGADISFGRKAITSLANGANADVPIGTNIFVEVSGPSAAYSIAGMTDARDGKLVILLNRTGYAMSVLHESGLEATTANRIVTLSGADRTAINSAATFIYSAAASRWVLIGFDSASDLSTLYEAHVPILTNQVYASNVLGAVAGSVTNNSWGSATISTGAVTVATSTSTNLLASVWDYTKTLNKVGIETNTSFVVTNAGDYRIAFGAAIARASASGGTMTVHVMTNQVSCKVVWIEAAGTTTYETGFKEFVITLPANCRVGIAAGMDAAVSVLLKNVCFNVKAEN